MSKSQTLKLDRISEQTLRNLPLPENGERTYTITYTRGLTVRVRSGGSKSFYARIWNPRTKRVLRRKIGEWPEISCTKAIKAFERLRKDRIDTEWKEQLDRPTLGEVFKRYQNQKALEQKSTSFLQLIEQAWRCVPVRLHNLLLDDVPLFDLADLVSNVAQERPGTAFHVRRLLKAIYRMSVLNE